MGMVNMTLYMLPVDFIFAILNLKLESKNNEFIPQFSAVGHPVQYVIEYVVIRKFVFCR